MNEENLFVSTYSADDSPEVLIEKLERINKEYPCKPNLRLSSQEFAKKLGLKSKGC